MARIIIFIIFFSLLLNLKTDFLNKIRIKQRFRSLKEFMKKFYRILKIKNRSEIVWRDLIQYHIETGLKFGQYDADRYIKTAFRIDDETSVNFTYSVSDEHLQCRVIVLNEFDEEKTNDIMVLASHFNSLLQYGVIKVILKYNYVEFVYSGELLTYLLYPGEINRDLNMHYNISLDCIWAFKKLLETGDDPVFVFSEFLKKKEEEKNEK